MSYLKTLFIICPIFFISGIIDSIGGGGGLIALPTYLMIGLPVRSAYGCNKLQAGLGNLISAIKYFKNNMVDLRIALISAITAMTGAWIGTKIIFLLPEESIQKAITVALPVIALIMVLRKTDARNVIMRSEISKKNSCSGPNRRRDHGILQQSFRTRDRYRSDHCIYDDHAL